MDFPLDMSKNSIGEVKGSRILDPLYTFVLMDEGINLLLIGRWLMASFGMENLLLIMMEKFINQPHSV